MFSLSSKSVFFTKLVILFLLVKFACALLAEKYSTANLLNSWVVIHLSWSWSVVIFISISVVFVLYSGFLTKLLSILFSAAVGAVVVAKLVMLGILFFISFILALRAVVVSKLVILDIF